MPFDELGEWRPNKKQAQLLAVPFSVKEAAYLGGAGSGKSELLLMFPIVHGFHKHPKFKQLFLRRTHKQLNKEIVPRGQEIYSRFDGKWNGSDSVFTFPREDQYGGTGLANNGARIFLGHCENESDAKNYDSMEINLFTPDEIQSLTEYIYLYIGFTRVRTNSPDLPAIIRAAGMPGDIGHSFVKKRFVDPYVHGGKIIVGKSGIKRIFIHATQADNPNVDPNYAQSLASLPEAEKQAKLFGSWDAYLGQVFEEFRDKKYPDEPENAIHVVPQFDIPDWWPKIVAIDWGYNAMCSVGWGAISPTKRLYIYRHQMFIGKKIEIWGPLVKYHIEKENPADIIICHSANQHRGDPNTILEQVTNALGVPIRLGERDRIAGKMLIHEALRWETKDIPESERGVFSNERAAWILRNHGLESYHQYMKSFDDPEEEANIPKLQLFDLPDVLIIAATLKACVYAKTGADGKKKEDVAEFAGDDPYDMLRMLLHAFDKFFEQAENEQKKLDQVQVVHNQLAVSGDMTSFYRNMRRIERQSGDKIEVVRTFARRR